MSDSRTWLEPRTDGVVLHVHVQPGARRTGVVGTHGSRLKIAVSAPPLEGRANEAVIEVLASALTLPRRAFALQSGEASRDKRIFVATALSLEDLGSRLMPRPK